MQSIRTLITLLTLLSATGVAAAQAPSGDVLPPRCFRQIGTSKLHHGSQILCLAYSPKHPSQIAAGGGTDPLRLWDTQTGELVKEFNEPWVQAVTFSASGTTLIYASLQKKVRLYNFILKKEFTLDGHKAAIKAVAMATDPEAPIIASGSQDGAIYLWDLNTKSKVGELKGHTDEVTALVFPPDNSILISAGGDRAIHFWNLEKNVSIRKLDAGCGVQALAVSPDSKTLYSAGDDYLIRRWDIATGKQTGVCKGHEGIVVSLIVHGDTLVSGVLDRTIRFWDAKTTALQRTLPRRPGDCNALAMNKAGDFLATAGTNNVIRILATETGKEVDNGNGLQAGLTALVASPDRTKLAGLTLDGRLHLWDAPSGKPLRDWDTKHTGDVHLAWTPDGKMLTTAADSVRFWDPQTGGGYTHWPMRAPVMSLAFAPDTKRFAAGLRDGTIEVWDGAQKKVVQSFKYPGELYAVAWSPNGNFIAAGGQGKIMLWNTSADGGLFKSFDVKEGPPPVFPQVASLHFGPDSRTLAAGGFDASIRVYPIHAKDPTAAISQIICEGHTSWPYAVAFSPDGGTLVSGSFDKTVRLWEAFSGKQIAEFKGHTGGVMGVAFAADGRSVSSAGLEGVIYQWDVPGLSGNGKLPELTLTFQELERAWNELSSETTPAAHTSMWRAIAFGKQSIPHIAKRLYLLDPERVKKLFKELDSNHFATRTAAMKELEGYGRWMEGRYNEAIANPPSLEYKRRVETLKEKLNAVNSPSLAQERLRVRRFMLMCEQVGGPEAREAMQKLADKGPEEELREEAKGSLQRMK